MQAMRCALGFACQAAQHAWWSCRWLVLPVLGLCTEDQTLESLLLTQLARHDLLCSNLPCIAVSSSMVTL